MTEKIAVLAYNLGAPDCLESVEPFLYNLFNDPAIIPLPTIARTPLAKFISWRRAKFATEIYTELGGSSPLLDNTEAQTEAIEKVLKKDNPDSDIRCFIAMRYWKPFLEDTYSKIQAWGADRVIILSLYPQFSTTTVGSFMRIWRIHQKKQVNPMPFQAIACYPVLLGFIETVAKNTYETYNKALKTGKDIRILFSAHGIPQDTVKAGDGYQYHCEQTVVATRKVLAEKYNLPELDWVGSFQSRVGPKKWLQPYTEDEIRRAAKDGVALVIVPTAFISEHSETLVELDIEYRELAEEKGLHDYFRAPTASIDPVFIQGLADMVTKAVRNPTARLNEAYNGCDEAFCPREFKRCVCVNNPNWQGSLQ